MCCSYFKYSLITILFTIQMESDNYKIVLFIEPNVDFLSYHQLLSTLISSLNHILTMVKFVMLSNELQVKCKIIHWGNYCPVFISV